MNFLENQALLARVELGLNPAHDLLEAICVLHREGKEAFEKIRGPVCEYAHTWKPKT